MKRLTLAAALLFLPTSAFAQHYADNDRYDDHYDDSVSGEPVASVEVFYDQLSPYGVWVDDPHFGRVFIPDINGFVPYTEGHWQQTTLGFVWISAEPFAWATVHYGRWIYSRAYRRWAWRPDTVWGPSWVEWRMSGDYFGWAPLAPEVSFEIGYAPPIESWRYCASSHFFDTNVSRYYEPQRRVIELHRDARPIENYANIGGSRVVVGPSAAILRERHLESRPAKIEARAIGRWTPAESRDAVKRAQEHRAANEELNHKRLENNAPLREAQQQVQPAANQPPVREAPHPPQIQQPKTEQPRQPAVQQPRPAAQQPRPQVQQQPRQQPRPQVQQEPKQPQVQQEPKQRPTQQPRPQVQQEPRQPPAQQPRPQIQQQPKQPPAQQPRPQIQQQPKQPPAQQRPQIQQQPKQPPAQRPRPQEPRQPAPDHKRQQN